LRCILGTTTGLLLALILIVTTESNFAASGTWEGDFNGDWNFVLKPSGFSNWTGDVVPNGSMDTATFESSSTRDVFISADTEVDGIVFQQYPIGHADAFTISVGSELTLTISGVGITNTSGIIQNFVTVGCLDELSV